jgi:transcriptional regulator with XRE-family HTH domain
LLRVRLTHVVVIRAHWLHEVACDLHATEGTIMAVSALSKRLQSAKADRSIDDIVRLAERAGHKIHRSVVARYLNGEHGPRPSDKALAALAAGFGVDVRELRTLADMPPGELEPWEPTPESVRLNREQREALNQLIRAIVRGGSDAWSEPRKKTREPGVGVSKPIPLGQETEQQPRPQPAPPRHDQGMRP